MLNWPRVTCSSRASMLACCSKRKLVTRAMTPVLSRPMTVMVANSLINPRLAPNKHESGGIGKAGILISLISVPN